MQPNEVRRDLQFYATLPLLPLAAQDGGTGGWWDCSHNTWRGGCRNRQQLRQPWYIFLVQFLTVHPEATGTDVGNFSWLVVIDFVLYMMDRRSDWTASVKICGVHIQSCSSTNNRWLLPLQALELCQCVVCPRWIDYPCICSARCSRNLWAVTWVPPHAEARGSPNAHIHIFAQAQGMHTICAE